MTLPIKLIQREVCPDSKKAVLGFLDAQGGTINPKLLDVFCSRGIPAKIAVKALLSDFRKTTKPSLLPDISKAAVRIGKNIMEQKPIGIECDFDVDGATGGQTLYRALTEYFHLPENLVKVYIGERLTEGYGLSDGLATRIINDPDAPDLIVTVDNGSSDAARITRLKEAGIDVVVTDHHEIPAAGIPEDAVAVVSPARKDSEYGDSLIAGCAVAFLLACHLKDYLVDQCWLDEDAPYPIGLLDYVSLGTVADCVSMSSSFNNRAFVHAGLRLLNQCNRPCWRVYRQLMMEPTEEFNSATIGFGIGPLINAAGRVADPFTAFNFLKAETDAEAYRLLQLLIEDNKERKAFQKEMQTIAVDKAMKQVEAGKQMMTVFLGNGHPGVHGITASRVVERTGKPTAIFSPKGKTGKTITASLRSVQGIHIKQLLDTVASRLNDPQWKGGGHSGAGGATISADKLDEFTRYAEEAVLDQMAAAKISPADLVPFVLHDGELDHRDVSLDFYNELKRIEPYGREFEEPRFVVDAEVQNIALMGEDKNHARITLKLDNGLRVKAVWFFCVDALEFGELQEGQRSRLVVQLSENHFRGSSSLQLMVSTLDVN